MKPHAKACTALLLALGLTLALSGCVTTYHTDGPSSAAATPGSSSTPASSAPGLLESLLDIQPAAITIKISAIRFASLGSMPSVDFVDADGRVFDIDADPRNWFTNASYVSGELPGGQQISITGDGMRLTDGSHMLFTFKVDGAEYQVKLENGTEFQIEKDGDGYSVILDDNWQPT